MLVDFGVLPPARMHLRRCKTYLCMLVMSMLICAVAACAHAVIQNELVHVHVLLRPIGDTPTAVAHRLQDVSLEVVDLKQPVITLWQLQSRD